MTYRPAAAPAIAALATSSTTRDTGPIAGTSAVTQRAEREQRDRAGHDDAEQQAADRLALDVADQADRQLGDAEREHAAEQRRGDQRGRDVAIELAVVAQSREHGADLAVVPVRVAGAEHEPDAER